MNNNKIVSHKHKYWDLWKVLIVILIALVIRNYWNINQLSSKGVGMKVRLYLVKSIGSKGTVRCFYNFKVNNESYEGFYDSDKFNQGDSIEIIYLPSNPEKNQAKQFILGY
jgi:hypothetical protein